MAKQKIFLSYSRQDGAAFAQRIAVDLKTYGYDVWIDQEDIRAGMEWDTEIEKALEGCDCLLFLETEKSVVSVTCLDEVHYALEHDKKVIPLIFVDSKTPFRLNRLQHIDFIKGYDNGFAFLLNELEGKPQEVSYPSGEKPKTIASKLPFSSKNYWPLVVVTCLAVLVTVILLLTSKSKPAASAETTNLVPYDTITNNNEALKNVSTDSLVNAKEEEGQNSKEIIGAIGNQRKQATSKTSSKTENTARPKPAETKTEINSADFNQLVAGDWKLVGMQPKSQSQNGYLKIEATGDKATIKSYMQFYYPETNASSHLTIFNAFAGCNSCTVNKEVKLKVEDVAVGSRVVKKLEQDQPDGRKAGEIVLDANSNKSINATATLQFVDQNNAVITLRQPLTIALAHEFMLEPFVYTFRFKKSE